MSLKESERERERESVCVRVRVRERESERVNGLLLPYVKDYRVAIAKKIHRYCSINIEREQILAAMALHTLEHFTWV